MKKKAMLKKIHSDLELKELFVEYQKCQEIHDEYVSLNGQVSQTYSELLNKAFHKYWDRFFILEKECRNLNK